METIINLQHNVSIIERNIEDINEIETKNIQINELSDFNSRLIKLGTIYNQLNELSISLNNILNKHATSYNHYINTFKKLLNNAENNLDENIDLVNKNIEKNDKDFKEIVNKIGIETKIVYDINSVKETPIYYVSSIDQFAININGVLYRGNVGELLSSEYSNNKLQHCKFQNNCIKKSECQYYHDPLIFEGSRDRKNFHYTAWNYGKGKYNRRYGGLSTIETDLYNIGQDEKNQSKEQLIHDLLITQILNK